MNPRARKLLWVLLGVLLIGSLLLAGPAHELLHHGADGLGSCDFCHFASPAAPPQETLVFCIAEQTMDCVAALERIRDYEAPDQGHARAPPIGT